MENLPLSISLFSPTMFDPIPNPNFHNWNHNPSQESGMESDNSGVESPPLWKNSHSPSPSHPLLDCPNSLSPNSRTQAIARGQWELMEMVKNMPESSYELSLKDLVEHHRTTTTDVEQSHKEEEKIKVIKRQESCRKAAMKFEDKGLFLNVVSPFSIKSRKKDGNNKDWWKKKKFTGSSDSDSSRTTTTSASSASSSTATHPGGGDTGRRKRNGSLTSCWPKLQTRKREKPVE